MFALKNETDIGICYTSKKNETMIVYYDNDRFEISRKLLSNKLFFRVISKNGMLFAFNRTVDDKGIAIYKYQIQ